MNREKSASFAFCQVFVRQYQPLNWHGQYWLQNWQTGKWYLKVMRWCGNEMTSRIISKIILTLVIDNEIIVSWNLVMKPQRLQDSKPLLANRWENLIHATATEMQVVFPLKWSFHFSDHMTSSRKFQLGTTIAKMNFVTAKIKLELKSNSLKIDKPIDILGKYTHRWSFFFSSSESKLQIARLQSFLREIYYSTALMS